MKDINQNIIISEIWDFSFDDIESENILFRVLLTLLIPVKYLLSGLFIFAVIAYVFSGMGLIILLEDFNVNGSMGLYSYLVIGFDSTLLLIWIVATVKEK